MVSGGLVLERGGAVATIVITNPAKRNAMTADMAALARTGEVSLAVHAEKALASFPKPTIARIGGFCVGGGCQLAVACDLRVAADDSRFGSTPAKLGIVYPASSTHRLSGLVGPARAKLLLFTADLIDAPAAFAIGLVDRVVPAPDLGKAVDELAGTLTQRSQLTIHAAKATLAGRTAPAQDEDELEEGIAAFTGRRAPRFSWAG